MGRRRLGVVLLVPEPAAAEIDGLRRGCGDRRRERVAPHVTLVPPVNVRDDQLGAALAVVRAAATATAAEVAAETLVLRLGPPARFHPASPTLYLAVEAVEAVEGSGRVGGRPVGSGRGERGGGPGDGDEPGVLGALRARLRVPPLRRPQAWPFVPHVTLCDDMDDERAAAALTALADYRLTVVVDRLHVLEERRLPGGDRRWVPVADTPFARPAVVGRGGVELELAVTRSVDPEGLGLLAGQESPAGGPDVPAGGPVMLTGGPALPVVPPGARPVVVTARHRGVVVGVAAGWSRDDDDDLAVLVVDAEHRGRGVGRQLRLAFAAAAPGPVPVVGPAG